MAKMHTFFFKKNKKGFSSLLEEFIWVGFAITIVVGFFTFFSNLQAAVLGGEDDGSEANFNRLYSKIEELIESSDDMDYRIMNYFIGVDKKLIGFDTNWVDTRKIIDLALFPDSEIHKPFKCGNAACLCLYSDDWEPRDPAQRDKGVISCRSNVFADENVVFLGEGSEQVKPRTAGIRRTNVLGNYLVFYGQPSTFDPAKLVLIKDYNWDVIKEIYIEKRFDKRSNTYYIYISKIDTANDDDPANKRKAEIDILNN